MLKQIWNAPYANAQRVEVWTSGATYDGTGLAGLARRLGPNEKAHLYYWKAWATPNGWDIEIENTATKRMERFSGSSWTLELEVASAVTRAL